MKNFNCKKIQIQTISDKPNQELKVEQGSSITYLHDLNLYIYFGIVKVIESSNEPKKQQPKKNPFSFKGGFTAPQKQNLTIQYVHVFNPTINKWKVESCTGKFPNRRVYHYVFYQSPYLLVYGGIDKKAYGDIFALNCKTWVWKKLFLLESPPPRLYGQFVSWKEKKYLIGGVKQPDNTLLNDIWELSFANVNWQVSSNELPGGVWYNIDYKNANNTFTPLKYFTANVFKDESIYIFGGFAQNNQSKNTEFVFSMKDKEMKLVDSKGSKPTPRGKHKSTEIKKNVIVIYGGCSTIEEINFSPFQNQIFLINLESLMWEKVALAGSIPNNLRYLTFASNLSLSNQSQSQILLLGLRCEPVQSCQYILNENLIKQQEETLLQNSFVIEKKVNPHKKTNSIEDDGMEELLLSEKSNTRIDELEENLLMLKQQNQNLKEKLHSLREDRSNYQGTARQEGVDLTSKLLSLLVMQHKKRRFLQLKSNVLQNTIKDAEKLVMLLDCFSQEQIKNQHIKAVKEIRSSMQEVCSKEKFYKKEINSKKGTINLDINKLFVEGLSEQESRLFTAMNG